MKVCCTWLASFFGFELPASLNLNALAPWRLFFFAARCGCLLNCCDVMALGFAAASPSSPVRRWTVIPKSDVAVCFVFWLHQLGAPLYDHCPGSVCVEPCHECSICLGLHLGMSSCIFSPAILFLVFVVSHFALIAECFDPIKPLVAWIVMHLQLFLLRAWCLEKICVLISMLFFWMYFRNFQVGVVLLRLGSARLSSALLLCFAVECMKCLSSPCQARRCVCSLGCQALPEDGADDWVTVLYLFIFKHLVHLSIEVQPIYKYAPPANCIQEFHLAFVRVCEYSHFFSVKFRALKHAKMR